MSEKWELNHIEDNIYAVVIDGVVSFSGPIIYVAKWMELSHNEAIDQLTDEVCPKCKGTGIKTITVCLGCGVDQDFKDCGCPCGTCKSDIPCDCQDKPDGEEPEKDNMIYCSHCDEKVRWNQGYLQANKIVDLCDFSYGGGVRVFYHGCQSRKKLISFDWIIEKMEPGSIEEFQKMERFEMMLIWNQFGPIKPLPEVPVK